MVIKQQHIILVINLDHEGNMTRSRKEWHLGIENKYFVPLLFAYFCSPLTFSSVQFSRTVMSDTLWSHELQHARPPCPSPNPEPTQTCVRASDAIQPSHPLLSPSPPVFNLSQHQGLFKWVNSSHQVAKVLQFQLHHWSFQWTTRTDLLQDGLLGSPCSPRDSQVSSPRTTTIL